MTTCPEPEVLVENAIDQVMTQYRESPNLLGLLRGALRPQADTVKMVCEILDAFDIETATGDQLTIIGKWLGWPRRHCAGRLRTVFGFACQPLTAVVIVDGDGAIVVDCPPIEYPPVFIQAFPVVVATINEPYQSFIITATGGVPPYEFSVTGGPLPAGMTLAPLEEGVSAILSGTPTETGEFEITISVTDDVDQTDDLDAFTLTVYE